ncbi:MAG: DUF1232 domain-containing protein [Myxococcales bacterium]|nr:DUF1232 domain-containing protein [Myxococcales bacterium]MCB9651150.1 DUF1232 domain-containing protein [Deltaproteobacteria bacterium]
MFLTLMRHPVRTLGATLRFFFSLKTPILPRLAALLALAYVVWPVDLIPDVAPILGWLDDAGFATLAFGWVMKKVGEAEAARLPAPAPERSQAERAAGQSPA